MELLSHRLQLHSKTPCFSSGLMSSNYSTYHLLFLPGYGKLKACPSHCLCIKAVLEAPREVAKKQKKSLEKQITGEGGALKRCGRGEEQNEMGMEDGSAESTWEHRAWVATGHIAIAAMVVKAMEGYTGTMEDTLGMIGATMGGYILADFATGLYHWGIDNYGNAKTLIFGTQIDGFQAHHKRPWVISTGQFANNIHRQARPATIMLAPFLLFPGHAVLHSFLAIFSACVVYSQQFHSWVHAKHKDVPPFVLTLQKMGLLLPRKMHATHHRPPYDINYCIVSGLCNPLLDHFHFFAKLEKLIFLTFHIRPRSWAETSVDWVQTGSYFVDGTDMDDLPAP